MADRGHEVTRALGARDFEQALRDRILDAFGGAGIIVGHKNMTNRGHPAFTIQKETAPEEGGGLYLITIEKLSGMVAGDVAGGG